jgi:hypothetical protein
MANQEQQDQTIPWGSALSRFKSGVDTSRKGRKTRHVTVTGAIDKRSLRATGRTEQMNFKVTPQIRDSLAKRVGRGKMSLWLEQAIVAKLKEEGFELE